MEGDPLLNISTKMEGDTKKRSMETTPLESRKKKSKKVKTKHMDPKILELRRTLQISCGTNDLRTAKESYDRLHIKEGVKMESQSYYNLLNLCEGLSERGVHIGTPKIPNASSVDLKGNKQDTEESLPKDEFSNEERKKFAFEIKSEMDVNKLSLNETAYTALVRILCKNGDLEDAEKLIHQADSCAQCKPKLRMFSCLISAFCSRGELEGALRIWATMANIKRINKTGTIEISIEPTEKEYCMIMKCATITGDAKVMDRVVSELAEDVLVPSLDTTNTIINWFSSKHATCEGSKSALESVQGLPVSQAPSLGPFQSASSSPPEISESVPIDLISGTLRSGCLEGMKLKPVPLTSDAWQAMLETNEHIVLKGELEEHGKVSKFAGGGKGKKRVPTKEEMEKRGEEWHSFIHYLSTKFGPSSSDQTASDDKRCALDVVIDGANIGYYKQNFSNCPKHVDYQQIDRVIQYFKNQGKSVLLFLHERHFAKKLMPHWAEQVVDKWENEGILYRTPYGSNDDWFWMHAALWCGRNTMVLSNDEMRDHHFQMCAHRSFLRWKERQQAHFDIVARKVTIIYPDVYSRRIQKLDEKRLVIPLPKRGDENRFLDGSHEADDSAPGEETYVCIKQA